jgi:hypothetical protein
MYYKCLRVWPNISRLQLPSEKFQKSHKKFRMFDKNSDHHIGTSFKHSISPTPLPRVIVIGIFTFSLNLQMLPSFPKAWRH